MKNSTYYVFELCTLRANCAHAQFDLSMHSAHLRKTGFFTTKSKLDTIYAHKPLGNTFHFMSMIVPLGFACSFLNTDDTTLDIEFN